MPTLEELVQAKALDRFRSVQNFGDFVKVSREMLAISVKVFAEKSGLKAAIIKKIENNQLGSISQDILKGIAAGLGLSYDDIKTNYFKYSSSAVNKNTIGGLIQSTRMKNQLTIEEFAQTSKLPIKLLTNLEADKNPSNLKDDVIALLSAALGVDPSQIKLRLGIIADDIKEVLSKWLLSGHTVNELKNLLEE